MQCVMLGAELMSTDPIPVGVEGRFAGAVGADEAVGTGGGGVAVELVGEVDDVAGGANVGKLDGSNGELE